jgi:hypothetical protein
MSNYPFHSMKTYMGSRIIVTLTVDGVSGHFMSWPLYPLERIPGLIKYEASGFKPG